MQMNRPRLVALRRARGHTQETLAEAVGMSRVALGAIESGATERPRPATLQRLAEALGTTIEDITVLDDDEKAVAS